MATKALIPLATSETNPVHPNRNASKFDVFLHPSLFERSVQRAPRIRFRVLPQSLAISGQHPELRGIETKAFVRLGTFFWDLLTGTFLHVKMAWDPLETSG